MKYTHHRIAALAMVLLLCLSTVTARAAEAPPDLRQPGQIHLVLRHKELPVAGGTVVARQVADIVVKNSTYQYALTEAFAPSYIDLGDLSGDSLPQQLEQYADYAHIPGVEAVIAQDGTASFEALPLGLYLISQGEMTEGFLPLSAFLVSVPYEQDGVWMYSVEAIPKTLPEMHEMETANGSGGYPDHGGGDNKPGGGSMEDGSEVDQGSSSTGEDGGGTGENGSGTGEDGSEKLPQTGQLNWPVPVLTMVGLVLFITGWVLCYRKGGQDDAA